MNVIRFAKIDGDRATGARQLQCRVHRLPLNSPSRVKLRDIVAPSEARKLHPQEGDARAPSIPVMAPALDERLELRLICNRLLHIVGVRLTLIPQHAFDREWQDGPYHLVIKDRGDLVDVLPVGAERDATDLEFPDPLDRALRPIADDQRWCRVDSAAATSIRNANGQHVTAGPQRAPGNTVATLHVVAVVATTIHYVMTCNAVVVV